MQLAFWAESTDFNDEIQGDSLGTGNKMTAGRLTIVPNQNDARRSPFCVRIDFAPRLDPAATITYQAMIPCYSEIFVIVSCGTVTELIELLETSTASLTDHDEEGRSLLSVSFRKQIAENSNVGVACNRGYECRYVQISCG